jgi:hypothetical protein
LPPLRFHDFGVRVTTTTTAASPAPAVKLEITSSRQFTSWLKEQRFSLAFSTYQSGKLFLIGLRPDGRLSVFERTFERCMGLSVTEAAQNLWISSL